MNLDFERYLVDTNALFRLPEDLRTSSDLRAISRFPSEVIQEAGQYASTYDLFRFEYRTSATVLEHLKEVMAKVPTNDFSLVKLYENEGCADPLLVACALDAADKRAHELVGEVYVVATDDVPTREACARHGVRWLSTAEFVALLANGGGT